MPLFRYKALDEWGKNSHGMVDAETLQEAKQKLVQRQILVTEVFAVERKWESGKLKAEQILSLTRESARLLEAGLPLYETLFSLEEKYRGSAVHELLLDLCDQIRAGCPFSEALRKHSATFDLLYCSMIANAEKSGTLAKTLHDLANLIDRRIRLQKQLISALLYPSLLGSFCLIVLMVLLFFVVPSLFDLFEGKELHSFTRFVFAASRFALLSKWYLTALSVIAVVLGMLAGVTRRGSEQAKKIFLKIPGVRDLWSKLSMVQFFRASATLLEGGMPALLAMQQAQKLLRHPGINRSLDLALQQIQEGESLQKALLGKAFIPPLVPRMLGIAQAGGSLAPMMQQVASIYEDDLEKSFARITTLAQPILLLILGGIVGFVLLSVLLPLTDVSGFAA